MERVRLNRPADPTADLPTDNVLKTIYARIISIDGRLVIQSDLDEKTIRQLYINICNNKKTLSDRPTKDVRYKIYMPLAKRLSHIIKTKKNITHTSQQLHSWADEIRKLSENNKVDYERIKTVLDWYSDNIGGAYIPIIESGYSLKMKFSRLEDAMKRDQEPSKEKKIKYQDGLAYRPDKEGIYRNAAGERYID